MIWLLQITLSLLDVINDLGVVGVVTGIGGGGGAGAELKLLTLGLASELPLVVAVKSLVYFFG